MNFWNWFRVIGTVVILAVAAAIYYYSDAVSNQTAAGQETSGTIYYK